MEDAPKAPPGALHPSMGSEAHEAGTCKRCCFFPRGRCTNGYNCEFCHYEHEKRKRKNKKKKKGKDGSSIATPGVIDGRTVVMSSTTCQGQQMALPPQFQAPQGVAYQTMPQPLDGHQMVYHQVGTGVAEGQVPSPVQQTYLTYPTSPDRQRQMLPPQQMMPMTQGFAGPPPGQLSIPAPVSWEQQQQQPAPVHMPQHHVIYGPTHGNSPGGSQPQHAPLQAFQQPQFQQFQPQQMQPQHMLPQQPQQFQQMPPHLMQQQMQQMPPQHMQHMPPQQMQQGGFAPPPFQPPMLSQVGGEPMPPPPMMSPKVGQ
ncbi:unnamed protein product, partial [Polarella glacialis]